MSLETLMPLSERVESEVRKVGEEGSERRGLAARKETVKVFVYRILL